MIDTYSKGHLYGKIYILCHVKNNLKSILFQSFLLPYN